MALIKGALACYNNTHSLQQVGIVPAASGLH